MKFNETADEYLIQTANGEKFEYLEPDHIDDGLFGGETYEGIGRLGDFGERGYLERSDESSLDLFFEEKDERLHISTSYHFANMLLIATPRDPKGPYTISVYQDFTLVGWILGPDQAKLALHLVNNYKNGAAVFPLEGIDLTNTERKISIFVPQIGSVGAPRLNWGEIFDSQQS